MTLSKDPTGMRRHDLVWRFVPLVLWIGVIFFLSSGQGSFSETSRIIRPLLEFFFPTASPESITFYHGVIRKLAHFTEYAILAILAVRAFAVVAVPPVRRHLFISGLILVLLVAIADEFQQSFQPTRTSSSYDVLIDLFGGVAAISTITVVKMLRKRGESKRRRDDSPQVD